MNQLQKGRRKPIIPKPAIHIWIVKCCSSEKYDSTKLGIMAGQPTPTQRTPPRKKALLRETWDPPPQKKNSDNPDPQKNLCG